MTKHEIFSVLHQGRQAFVDRDFRAVKASVESRKKNVVPTAQFMLLGALQFDLGVVGHPKGACAWAEVGGRPGVGESDSDLAQRFRDTHFSG